MPTRPHLRHLNGLLVRPEVKDQNRLPITLQDLPGDVRRQIDLQTCDLKVHQKIRQITQLALHELKNRGPTRVLLYRPALLHALRHLGQHDLLDSIFRLSHRQLLRFDPSQLAQGLP